MEFEWMDGKKSRQSPSISSPQKMDRRRKRRENPSHHNNDDNKNNHSTNLSSSLSKRLRRASTEDTPIDDDDSFKSSSSSPLVMVTGLLSDCTVLELKSRFEMYGPISRTRIDAVDGSGYVTFRSVDSADAAVSASLDPELGIFIRSEKVIVCQAADPLLGWKAGTGASAPSELLRAEIPLSKHGRSNKKLSATSTGTKSTSDAPAPYKGREIVAYDDLF